jgi:hypothetical protein
VFVPVFVFPRVMSQGTADCVKTRYSNASKEPSPRVQERVKGSNGTVPVLP